MQLRVIPPLDPTFQPLSIAYRAYQRNIKNENKQPIKITLRRNNGLISAMDLFIHKDNTGHDEENYQIVERIVKTLLWVRGGYQVTIAGSKLLHQKLHDVYRTGGTRAFDADFMAGIYEQPFEVLYVQDVNDAPSEKEQSESIGKHLDGCRIGFDAGGSDRKVSAVVNGEAIYSEEVVWSPKTNEDPNYHYQGILDAMKTAASYMPRVDAIGVSSAGIYVGNRIMAASLFLKVPKDAFNKQVKDMYINAAKEIGDVPLMVANDGDVTALAGAMELCDGNVLGIAMGTSEAGGYIDSSGNITGWLNELAFVPVDLQPDAMEDEWSGDIGCGVKYFSQDGIIKLAPAAGITLDPALSPGEKLKIVQQFMLEGDPHARAIYETIGVYLGYALGWYSEFYDFRHLLLMGRVTSGEGGAIIQRFAKMVLDLEFPELAKVAIHLPDESSRRVGQSVAAASLPKITR